MTAVKKAACSKAAVRRHQMTCRAGVLDHGMMHVIAPDEWRRRLASGADFHASERYDGVQPYSDLNISVASVLMTGNTLMMMHDISASANRSIKESI